MAGADDRLIVGVDLGGTNVRACVATAQDRIIAHVRKPTPAEDGPEAVVDRVAESVREVVATVGGDLKQVRGVGVGAPGPLDMTTGVVFSPPNLARWKNVPLAKLLEKRLGIPVSVANDANLAAVGEHRFGGGRGVDDLVYITVSTGVGGGVIVGGKLFVGVSGTAGEIGHMIVDLNGPRCKCGSYGCLEAMAAGPYIARAGQLAARQAPASLLATWTTGDSDRVTTAMVVEAAQAGDATAGTVFERAAIAVGAGCVNLIHLFNPRRIIIGGGVSQAGTLLFDPIRRLVGQRALAIPRDACEIVPAELGDDVGLYGAVALVAQGVETLV